MQMPFNNQADQMLRKSTAVNNNNWRVKQLQSERLLTNIKSITQTCTVKSENRFQISQNYFDSTDSKMFKA